MADQPAQQRKPFVRRAVEYLIGFLIFVAVGKGFELISDHVPLKKAYQLQSEWIAAVDQMSPWHLAATFAYNFSEWSTPQSGKRECLASCPTYLPMPCSAFANCSQFALAACKSSQPGEFPLLDKSASDRCARQRQAQIDACEAENGKCEQTQQTAYGCIMSCKARYPESSCRSPTCISAALYFGLVGTGTALWHVGEIFALLQLFLACLGVAALSKIKFSGKRLFLFESYTGLMLIPIAIVAAGTIIAFALKIAMLTALGLLRWFTGLAAFAAGATGVLGFCWQCLVKIGEKSTDHALQRKVKL
jgi:hypothetical protein